MRLLRSDSKNATSLYVIKDVKVKNRWTTKIVENLGTVEEIKKKYVDRDPIEWAEEYVAGLKRLEKEGKEPDVIAKYSPTKLVKKDQRRCFNGGYLFLQKIYYKLGLHEICAKISAKYKFEYDLNSILSRLLYGRILYPSSKLSTYEFSAKLIEEPNFELHQIYRALEIIAKETDFIQSRLYQNSLSISRRNTGILYYDCTNYFFEIEQEEGLKQYGFSKDHKPNPLVQMGLFMDGDGIPLAFNITPGNRNEQLTLQPLEKKILADFKLSRFIVCTDAGLASLSNRKFNDLGDRAFVTSQSIKKLKGFLRDWALDPRGWHLANDRMTYDIGKLDEEKHREDVFYKERWIKEGGLEQKLIVTYSIKYRDYHNKIRTAQVQRALKAINGSPAKIKKHRQNDYKRFIKKTTCTSEGEIAEREFYSLDTGRIESEAIYDGFYAVCTNLEEEAAVVAQINKRRWRIEECFQILKDEFRARPVYLKRDDRIRAHFTTCFLALIIYRFLEKILNEEFTCDTIVGGLRGMDFKEIRNEGYEPVYTRTDFTDALHELFGFRTDYEIVTIKQMKNIFKLTKSR